MIRLAHYGRQTIQRVLIGERRVINDSVRGLFEQTETGAARDERQSAAGEFRNNDEEAE